MHNVLESQPQSVQLQQLVDIMATTRAIIDCCNRNRHKHRHQKREDPFDEDEDEGDATFSAAVAAVYAAPQHLEKARTAAEKMMQLNQRRADAAAAGAAGTGSSTATAPAADANTPAADNGLPLPAALVQAVLSRCDSRTAAAAAASCKQLHAAYAANSVLQMPSGLPAYLKAVGDVIAGEGDGWGDGSCEASFACKFPLDGSAAVGSDLVSLTRLV
jgi:hypothetical protein